MSEEVKNQIEEVIQSKPVAIFMKGEPNFPACGFSARAVQVLQESGVTQDQLTYFDVLEDDDVRSGIKEYSNWPTIPQVYVKGKFLGGSDTLMEMYEKGEIQKVLEN